MQQKAVCDPGIPAVQHREVQTGEYQVGGNGRYKAVQPTHLRLHELPHPVCGQQQPLVLRAQLHHRRLGLCRAGQQGALRVCVWRRVPGHVAGGGMQCRGTQSTRAGAGRGRQKPGRHGGRSGQQVPSRAGPPRRHGALPPRSPPELTPTVCATASPSARLIASPGTQLSASHTRCGPTGWPRWSDRLRQEGGRQQQAVTDQWHVQIRGGPAAGAGAERRQPHHPRPCLHCTWVNCQQPPPTTTAQHHAHTACVCTHTPRTHRCAPGWPAGRQAPHCSTRPPLISMRARSSGVLGLWSRVRQMARQPRGSCRPGQGKAAG